MAHSGIKNFYGPSVDFVEALYGDNAVDTDLLNLKNSFLANIGMFAQFIESASVVETTDEATFNKPGF